MLQQAVEEEKICTREYLQREKQNCQGMTKSINVKKREKTSCGSDATEREHAKCWLQVTVFMLNINLKCFHLQLL